jgi:hypothetical protein
LEVTRGQEEYGVWAKVWSMGKKLKSGMSKKLWYAIA